MNKYVLKLTDEYDNSVCYYVAETEKSLREVKKVYNMARKEWYKSNKDLDCLMGHITEKLAESGITIYGFTPDLELDF